jgi:hypothetical protein
MSPEAVEQRLRDVAQLYRLGMAIREFRRVGPVEESRSQRSSSPQSENANL